MKQVTHGAWVLGNILHRILLIETTLPVNYRKRNELVVKAVYYALLYQIPAGFRIDPEQPDWPVAFIELPTGQVSWHLPRHAEAWDGHTTDEKLQRVREFWEQTRV